MTKKTILVTDDDPGIQDVFKIILEKAGYEVIVNGNGNAILQDNYETPHIFLLDEQLSGVDGLDICKHLKSKEETKHIPVIMVSATPGLAPLAESAGADAWLEKPFHLKDLLAIVARYV